MNTKSLVIAVIGMLLAGCATAQMSDATKLGLYQRHSGPAMRHVTYVNVSPAVEVIDDSHLVLDGGPARSYLLTLGGSCLAYDRSGVFVGIDTLEDGQLDAGLDRVVIQRGAHLRCTIQAIQKVDLPAVRADLRVMGR